MESGVSLLQTRAVKFTNAGGSSGGRHRGSAQTVGQRDANLLEGNRAALTPKWDVLHPMVHSHVSASLDSVAQEIAQISVPLIAMLVGSIIHYFGSQTAGIMMLYFGGQAGISIFMKLVLSNAVVSEELGYLGVPAAFAVTAIQQIVGFVFLAFIVAMLYPTKYRYEVRLLRSKTEYGAVFALAVTFAANIGLNNFSLSYVPVSTNVMIRSSLPLAVYIVQRVMGKFLDLHLCAKISHAELGVMVMGVIFAGFVPMAQAASATRSASGDQDQVAFGIVITVFSVFAGALSLASAAFLGSAVELNALEMTLYMAVPSGVVLFGMAFFRHPCHWPGFPAVTDWDVLASVVQLKPSLFFFIVASWVLAACYNCFMFYLIRSLSATYAAFAGNFNKAGTILISILSGLEHLPQKKAMATLMITAVIGNLLSFAAYSVIKPLDKMPMKGEAREHMPTHPAIPKSNYRGKDLTPSQT